MCCCQDWSLRRGLEATNHTSVIWSWRWSLGTTNKNQEKVGRKRGKIKPGFRRKWTEGKGQAKQACNPLFQPQRKISRGITNDVWWASQSFVLSEKEVFQFFKGTLSACAGLCRLSRTNFLKSKRQEEGIWVKSFSPLFFRLFCPGPRLISLFDQIRWRICATKIKWGEGGKQKAVERVVEQKAHRLQSGDWLKGPRQWNVAKGWIKGHSLHSCRVIK